MGTASRILSVVSRICAIIAAAIVLGIASRFINLVRQGNGSVNSKIIFTETWAVLSIAFAIILIPPFMYSFFMFPLDLIMFIGWMVAFGLDYNLTGSNTCTDFWFWNYWGYYWGRFWYIPRSTITADVVGRSGCAYWRTLLAFSFIGGFWWLANFLLGLYNVARWADKRKNNTLRSEHPPRTSSESSRWWKREKAHPPTSMDQPRENLTSSTPATEPARVV